MSSLIGESTAKYPSINTHLVNFIELSEHKGPFPALVLIYDAVLVEAPMIYPSNLLHTAVAT